MAEKTNAMRKLTAMKIAFTEHYYADTGAIAGADVARALGEDPARVFKTLVTVGKTGAHYVFLVPVEEELDLKKAASSVGEKSVEMIKSKELLPLTGYIHGGCSPIGMKKMFKTVLHVSAESFETIIFSAGKIGYQVEVKPADLKKVVPYILADVVCE